MKFIQYATIVLFALSVDAEPSKCTPWPFGLGLGTCEDPAYCSGTTFINLICLGSQTCCITGACGAYLSSPVRSVEGNYNRLIEVVNIKPEHLTNPDNTTDNTMSLRTACAFDTMRSAAAKNKVIIKIQSGFRTLERQQYFYNCYQDFLKTNSCDCGSGRDCNLAARPGTSNHGNGIALDLNTMCTENSANTQMPLCSNSPVYVWLNQNAVKYGFKRTVSKEPWHWEFFRT